MVFTNNPGDNPGGSREAKKGIELGQKSQDSEDQLIDWKRGEKAEEMLIEYAKKKHTFTPDDVWNDLFDPAITDGNLPPVDNRAILGPMMKRLAEAGYVVDTKFMTRSTRRNGSPVRIYRTTDLHRNRWLRNQFQEMSQDNPNIQTSLDELKRSMDRDGRKIAELEEMLRKARQNVDNDEKLKQRFEGSGYNRRFDDVASAWKSIRKREVDSSYGGQFNDRFSFELENESGELSPIGEDGKAMLNLYDGFNFQIIIRDKLDGEKVGSINTDVEESSYGATGWSLALNPFSDMGSIIGLRIANPITSININKKYAGNERLFYQLAEDYVENGVVPETGYADESGFKLLPYDQRTVEMNEYIRGISGDDSEELGISPQDNYYNLPVRDENTIQALQRAERFLVEEGLLEDWGGELQGSPFIERELNGTYTTAYFDELSDAEKSSLATFTDWYFQGTDQKRKESAEKILIGKIKDARKSYKNPSMAWVSRQVLDDLEWSLTDEQWEELLKDPIIEQYINKKENGVWQGYYFESPEGDGQMDLLFGILESENENIISDYFKRYWQILSARSRPSVSLKDWELRYDDNFNDQNRARDLGVQNLNAGFTFNRKIKNAKKIRSSKQNTLLYRNYDQGRGVVRKYVADGRGRIKNKEQAWSYANQLRSNGFYVRSVKMSDGTYLNYRSPNNVKPIYRNFRLNQNRK